MSNRPRPTVVAVAVILGSSAAGRPAAAAPCTDGVDCLCDLVEDPGSPRYDDRLLLCEDFEAVTLHDDVNRGGDAPLYGPWDDDSGQFGWIGENSHWARNFGAAVSACAFPGPEPGGLYATEWSAGDPWGGNDHACVDILRGDEFDDEVAALRPPTLPDGGRGVFDGAQAMGSRIGPGKTGGIFGEVTFGRNVQTVGLTMGLAYAENLDTAGVLTSAWKHNQFVLPDQRIDGSPFNHHLGSAPSETDPFQALLVLDTSMGDLAAWCTSALAGAELRTGTLGCNDSQLLARVDPTAYQRSRDFAPGSWGCIQGYLGGLGSTETVWTISLNGRAIFDVTVDTSRTLARDGYVGMVWNNFANTNQTLDNVPCEDNVCTTETTLRYEDNVVLREGPPVSCSEIGFGADGADPVDEPGCGCSARGGAAPSHAALAFLVLGALVRRRRRKVGSCEVGNSGPANRTRVDARRRSDTRQGGSA